jgi:hypothetical protein
MEPPVSQDLRAATIRLAASMPAGSPSRHALLQVLASSRTAAKTGEKELGGRHPELKRAIEGLSKKVQALDDEMADVVKLADKAEAALARESGSGERTDEEEVAAEAAGAAGRLLRDLQKVSKHLSDATDLLDFYKREL